MSISILGPSNSPKLKFIGVDKIEIKLDASLRESHSFSSSITQYPIENGGVITDHVSDDPIKLTINGFITNAPITLFFLDDEADLGDLGEDETRVSVTYEALISLKNSKEVFTLVTGLKSYKNMLFTSLVFPRGPRIGVDNLEFTAEVVQVELIESKEIEKDQAIDSPEGTADQASSTKDVGKQTPATSSAGTQEKASIAHKALY